MLKKISALIYWLLIIALLALFFTNDFGLVDIHKTTIAVAVGIDAGEGELKVTAQLAVPQPSQGGENVQYSEVQGSGVTVAEALNEINSKTGFYPKLLFCKLILLGESCQEEELFRVLGCFYRKNFSELTALVAMCKGKASDMLSIPSAVSPETVTAIQRALSDELEKSANVASVNLRDIAATNYSVSAACYMPYVEANVQGTSESGGNGDNVGGESGGGEGGGSSQSGGEEGGGSSQSGGEESGGSSSGSQNGGSEEKMEFTARKTAIFSDGRFAGILDESQSFALNILKNDIRLAVLPCDAEEVHYTMGLKSARGGIKLKVKEGVPELTLSFGAKAQIQSSSSVLVPDKTVFDDVVPKEVLKGAEEEVKSRLEQLVDACTESDCDILGVKELLHKYNYKYYEAFKDNVLTRAQVKYNINIKSVN